jgi:hypothetical protein
MRQFGNKSKTQMSTLHPELRRLLEHVLQVMDITVTEGHRGEAAQNEAQRTGKSKLRFPDGAHNSFPSNAVDIAPWPIPDNWGDPGPDKLYTLEELRERAKFYYLAGIAQGIAYELGIPLRWGGDWNMDNQFKDQKFDDLVHFELRL